MLQHISAFSGFSVKDIGQAKDFYENVLGLAIEQSSEGLQVQFQDGKEVFLYPKQDHAPATYTVLNFVVEDINTAVDQLAQKGVTLENYDSGPMKADEKGIYRGKAAGYGPDIAWFKDPSGNILSLIQN
ncbi:MAG: glyoxalase [Candidatus Kaiserbacteria bacterium]|nr:glyoxalase [Candidatus Kaiserbacteria bacterium]